jgi:hypothetical protein
MVFRINLGSTFVAGRRQQDGADSAGCHRLPKNKPKIEKRAAKKPQRASRIAGQASKRWKYERFRR